MHSVTSYILRQE